MKLLAERFAKATTLFAICILLFTNGEAQWSEVGGTNNFNGEILSITTDANGNVYAAGGFTNDSGYKYVAKYTPDPLPVNLITLTATKENNNIAVNWQTATETNTSHYNMQRSTDGNEFKTVGSVKAKGAGDYSSTDCPPASQKGALYYRLGMVDNDGSITYSKVVSVQFSADGLLLTVFPNPVKDVFSVHLINNKSEKATVQVMDMQGKVVINTQVQLQEGDNNFSLPLAALAKGAYVLVVNGVEAREAKFAKE